jgi:hypothetical protein
MPAELRPTSISGGYSADDGVTTINVSFVYESTKTIETAKDVANETLHVINRVPNKPPNGKDTLCLRSCSVNQIGGNKATFTASATYDDKTPCEGGKGSGGGGKASEFPDGGGRGPCLPADKETTTTVRAVKDFPLKNNCGTPIMPSPQIEVAMLQRTVVSYQLGSDTGQAQKDLKDGMGKIDLQETARQNARLGIDQRDDKNCPPNENAPAPGGDADERFDNRPCGSMLQGGNIGAIEQGPCGPMFPVTKTFVDGDFQAPGIFQADYLKCGGYGATNELHTGVHNGATFPIVALRGIGGVIPWPGQPAIKK